MDRLAAYRKRHVITPASIPDLPPISNVPPWVRMICERDDIRIVPRYGPKLGQGWRHDPDEIRRLVKEAASNAR